MKSLVVSLAAILFAFFAGCQETINDPIVPDGTIEENSYASKDMLNKDMISALYPNEIKLVGTLFDPSHPINNFVRISGVVRYALDRDGLGGSSLAPSLKINLYVNAVLKGGCPGQNHKWTVSSTSESIVKAPVADQLVVYLEKSFRVRRNCCGTLDLVLRFRVTEKSLELDSMWLKKIIGPAPVGDPT